VGLSSGHKFGPYEIVAPLGAGGMGEVYRARDTRLDRTVAIKVLPQPLSQNLESRQRLEREARTISKLSHPNICTLHDIGHENGMDFLVMEFVEGTTLRNLLAAGNLPISKVLPIAAQIAEGLAKAHESGVIHRDLKPENLMVMGDGIVKILDFGLARHAMEHEDSGDCKTEDFRTRPGQILGTIEYMSPEQANGAVPDFRSDQFALGLVLYEMATGRRAFRRALPSQTLLAIISQEPEPIGKLNAAVPPPLCWAIERCLAKDPDKRYASTRDLARDLAAIRDRMASAQVKRAEIPTCNLPVQVTAFVGRDHELAQSKKLLQRQDVRLLTITGPGGIGKSRLALELAREMMGGFSSGVYFVPLAAVGDPNMVASAIAETLKIRETADQPVLDALKNHFDDSRRGPILLLLDNFEHVVTAAPVLVELLTAAPGLKILVTSRAALHVNGEHEFPVPPLSLPSGKAAITAEKVLGYSAIALFVQRAKAVKPDFQLNEENAGTVAEICARLDGLPLAIELAAARVKLLNPAAILSRLASRLQLLTGGARDLPARQQTLRQAIDWSYDLLNEAEQKLFRRLSVFIGGCTLDAAESVCDTSGDLGVDVLTGMSSMVDKSLVRQVEQADGEPRFVMLETIREYGLEKLATSGEEPATRRAHAAYCLVLAEEGASEEHKASFEQYMARFESEHDNFRTALRWLTGTGNVEWGLRLGTALFRFWETREHLAEGRDRLTKLLNLKEGAVANKTRMRALFAAGVLAGGQGDYDASDTVLRESLEIARGLADKRSIAIALNALAVHARDRGDAPSARALYEESLALWRELEDPLAVARALSNLGNVVKIQGDFPKARALYEECLSIFRKLEDKTGEAWALDYLGDVAREEGDVDGARTLYEQSLQLFRQLQDPWGTAGSLGDLGNLAREQGNYQGADSLYRESMKIFQQLEHKRGIARVLESFACSAAEQAQPERALRLAGAAAALRKILGAPLTASEQQKLERCLEPVRQGMTIHAGGTAWLEGWSMSIERAVEEVLASA
jgi:predicted ATPase